MKFSLQLFLITVIIALGLSMNVPPSRKIVNRRLFGCPMPPNRTLICNIDHDPCYCGGTPVAGITPSDHCVFHPPDDKIVIRIRVTIEHHNMMYDDVLTALALPFRYSPFKISQFRIVLVYCSTKDGRYDDNLVVYFEVSETDFYAIMYMRKWPDHFESEYLKHEIRFLDYGFYENYDEVYDFVGKIDETKGPRITTQAVAKIEETKGPGIMTQAVGKIEETKKPGVSTQAVCKMLLVIMDAILLFVVLGFLYKHCFQQNVDHGPPIQSVLYQTTTQTISHENTTL